VRHCDQCPLQNSFVRPTNKIANPWKIKWRFHSRIPRIRSDRSLCSSSSCGALSLRHYRGPRGATPYTIVRPSVGNTSTGPLRNEPTVHSTRPFIHNRSRQVHSHWCTLIFHTSPASIFINCNRTLRSACLALLLCIRKVLSSKPGDRLSWLRISVVLLRRFRLILG
jgi:hypothetical protein